MIPEVFELCKKLRYTQLDPYFRDDEQYLLSIVEKLRVTIVDWYAAQAVDPDSLHSRGLRDPFTPRGCAGLAAEAAKR